MVLRAAGAEAVKDIWEGNQLLRGLGDAGFDTTPVRRLIRDVAVAGNLAAAQSGAKADLRDAVWTTAESPA